MEVGWYGERMNVAVGRGVARALGATSSREVVVSVGALKLLEHLVHRLAMCGRELEFGVV